MIQYETDWTIDVEKDDDEQPVNVDQDEDDNRGTPMDVDGSTHDDRSVSVAPSQPAQMSTRRGPRGQYRRDKNISSNALSESLDPDGGLPGSKEGIGAFPSGSDWAKTMFALKLKGNIPCCQVWSLFLFLTPFSKASVTKQKRRECG